MSKVAKVRLYWTRSASSDASSQVVDVTKDGLAAPSVEVPMEVQEFVLDVEAQSSVQFKITTKDSEGQTTTSDVYTFTLGDLTAPQPATVLGHEVMSVSDVPDPTPAPTPTPSPAPDPSPSPDPVPAPILAPGT